LSHRVSELASDCGALIVDLAEVDFIAIDGLRALIALNIQCARTGTTWALIASHAVTGYFEWEITTSYFPLWDRRPRP
jgi:anti-anti-sigma regulatory factor